MDDMSDELKKFDGGIASDIKTRSNLSVESGFELSEHSNTLQLGGS